ncbi:MAG: DUF1761 domain-containing protein [Bacteroidota bacterium]
MKAYNLLAIITSAIAGFALDFVWFTLLFRTAYIEDLERTKEQLDKGPSLLPSFIIQLAGNLVMAFVLAWLINKLNYQRIAQSLQLCLLVWIGFVVAIIGPMYAFQAFSFRFFLIITVGYLIPILLSGIILTVWKK